MPVYRKKTTKENKRKKVVKGESLNGKSKFKTVTNKKTGTTTTKTKTKASGSTKSSKTKTSVKTPKGLSGAQAMAQKTAKSMVGSIRKIAPNGGKTRQIKKVISPKIVARPKMATRIKKK
jgi:hypothetical protein